VELCQVGIEHRHKVHLKELCCEFRWEDRISKEFCEKLYQVGIEHLCCGAIVEELYYVNLDRREKEPESLRILKALPGGHRAGARSAQAKEYRTVERSVEKEDCQEEILFLCL
jgi:hypothetical protein